MLNPVAIVLLAGAGLYLYSKNAGANAAGSASPQLISFKIQTVKFSLNFLTPIMTIVVGVQNQNNVPFVVNSVVANCFLNGSYAGNASTFKELTAPANMQTAYPVEVRMSVAGMYEDAQKIMRGEVPAGASITLQGNIKIDGVTHPMNLVYKIV